MAQPDREAVYAALLSLLAPLGPAGSGQFGAIQRRFTTVLNADTAQAPYLIQVQRGESVRTTKGMPELRVFKVLLLIYAYFGGEASVVPATALNGLVSAVEAQLQPSNYADYFQQLGIPVSSLVVNGEIDYADYQAATGGQWNIAAIPVEIVATY